MEFELFDERLALWSLSAEAEKAERERGDIYFHADEPMGPFWVREVGLFEHADGARFGRAADENDRPCGEFFGHYFLWKWAAFWGAILARCAAL